MSSVILNGLGCNLKTSTGWRLVDLHPDLHLLESDTSSVEKIIELGLMTYSYVDRLKIKAVEINESLRLFDNNLIDRSLIDILIFFRFNIDGDITNNRDITDIYEYYKIEQIAINVESSWNIPHILILNENYEFIKSIINNEDFKNSSRSDIYDTPEEFFKLQAKYEYYYRNALSPDQYEVIRLYDGESIDKMINKISNKVSKILNLKSK